MKPRNLNWLALGTGLLLLAAGLLALKWAPARQGALVYSGQILPLVGVGPRPPGGAGCAALCLHRPWLRGVWERLKRPHQPKVLRASPRLQKQIAIDQDDERNIALSNRAKAKAFDAMLYLFGACLIAFSLMGDPLFATLALVAAYLLTVGLLIFYLNKYHKEM